MKFSTVSLYPGTLRSGWSIVLAIGALAVVSARAHAAELDPITISVPTVTTVGHELETQAPIEKTTVKAQIAVDAETLRNDSGVVLLNDRVLEAARKACDAADPFRQDDDNACIHEAVKSAKPQVDAAIARARSGNVTG